MILVIPLILLALIVVFAAMDDSGSAGAYHGWRSDEEANRRYRENNVKGPHA